MGRRITLVVILTMLVSVLAAVQALAEGKYCLAYWRELAAYENGAPPAGTFGNHSAFLHVWDEAGNPLSGKQIWTSWNVYLGSTDANGYCEVALYRPNAYDFQIRDGSNLTDTTPLFDTERPPNWGHYSWEIGFMYKADSNNPGTFDTAYDGTLNSASGEPCNLDAPCTRSLAYCSTIPTEYCSDEFALGNWVDSHGQTFVATGNRVIACKAQCTIGYLNHLTWTAQIFSGGPGGAAVGPPKTTRDMVSDEYWPILIKWGVNGVPVVPGQTYYLKIWRTGGLNTYHVTHNNYADGQYYVNGSPVPGQDLKGLVVCANVSDGGPTTGTISGYVKDTNNVAIAGATVSTSPGGYTTSSAADGSYTLSNVVPGTYDVTASKTGYIPQTQTGKTVAAGETTTVNFNLEQEQQPFSGIQNRNFEGGFYYDPDIDHQSGNYWHRFALSGISKAGGVYGTYHSPNWSQTIYESSWTAGIYQQATGCNVGNNFTASAWVRGTDSNVKFWVGIDPYGGTNASSANVQWSSQAAPGANWTQISKQVQAQSSTITMFIKAQNAIAANRYAYIDDADLVDDGGGAPPAYGTIAGYVRDTNNAAISGASVSTNIGGYSTTSGADGSYTLSDVLVGTYDVTASKTGYVSQTQTGKLVTENQTTTVNFNLAPQSEPFSGISNGDFEGGFYYDPDIDHQSGNSWHRFALSGVSKSGGDYGVYHSSHWSQTIYESSWVAGIYQQATGATVGSSYTASVWVRGADTNVKFWVGIDPYGGTNASSANVQWSSQSVPGSTWAQLSKTATAQSSTITMFIKAQNTVAANRYAWIDDASLVAN